MFASRKHSVFALSIVLAVACAAQAQQAPRTPRIGYVYPAGGQRGTRFEVTLGGQFLTGADSPSVSGTGIEAKVLEHIRPLSTAEANKLKEQLKELSGKRTAAGRDGKKRGGEKSDAGAKWTAEDEKLLAEIRKKLANYVRRPPNPAIAEIVKLQVTIAADAELGSRELRLGTSLGLTNPLIFCVDQLTEFREKPAQSATASKYAKPKFNKKKGAAELPSVMREVDTEITLPAVANGQILPGDVDRFRFTASKGQRVVVAVSARQLIPYLPDAVPGWFQATLSVYDAQGHELAYSDDYGFNPDPALCYVIPAAGQYVIEVKDSIYRGREDFVYRIAVGELPFVTSVFPLGGPAGAQTAVELKGWNLPATKFEFDGEHKQPGAYPLSVGKDELRPNCVPFAVDVLPECKEKEPNDQQAQAQAVATPVIVNGRIDQADDADIYRIDGRAGSELVAEVLARRLNSELDSVLTLTDAAGRQVAANDDHEDKGAGLTTHHADSYFRAKLPADGTYYLRIADAQHKGGAEYGYRLRLSPPQPDFELLVVPSSITARSGMAVPLTVYALRKDGFAGDIALGLKDAPEGFALGGGSVPGNQDSVRMTLMVSSSSGDKTLNLQLQGSATVEGRQIVRPAVPAEDMMQAFAYRHLVPSQELKVAVTGGRRSQPSVKVLGETPVKIPAGGTARVQFGSSSKQLLDKVEVALSDPPEGIAIKRVDASSSGIAVVFESDAAKVKPGLKGNLIATASRKGVAPAKAKQKNQRGAVSVVLPAIPFEIVAP